MRHEVGWEQARRVAAAACAPLPVRPASPAEAVGCRLARPVIALADLPPFPASAMDGFAVAGPGPWTVADEPHLAGSAAEVALAPGHAVPIATGAALPPGAEAVLRQEAALVETALHGRRLYPRDPLTGLADDTGAYAPAPGTDIRPAGEECAAGEVLVGVGVLVTPAVAGLAAAAGYDELEVVPPPVIATLVMGDELLERGLPRPGRVRDALGPLVPPWLAALGARANPPIRVPDSRRALLDEIEDAAADVIVTTGSTAAGPVDHLHDVLDHLGARWIIDGVAVRPGHPMLLAQVPDGRLLIGLPGNPLAAVSGLVTLAAPVIASLRGVDPAGSIEAVLVDDVTAHPEDTRLVPVTLERGGGALLARPLRYVGPGMLRGIALADGLAVIAPGGGSHGAPIEVVPLPPLP